MVTTNSEAPRAATPGDEKGYTTARTPGGEALAEVDVQAVDTMSDVALADALVEAADALEAAEAAEQAAAGVADPAEHHRLADGARWARARLARLRAVFDTRSAEAAERRRAEAIAEAERILTAEAPLSDVADAFRAVEDALDALVTVAEHRHAALVEAGRVLKAGGATEGSAISSLRPVLRLPEGVHSPADVVPGQLVAEAVLGVSTRRGLRTATGSTVTDLLTRSVPRLSRGKVARLVAAERDVEAATEDETPIGA